MGSEQVKQTSLKLLDFQMSIFVAQAGDRTLQTNCSYARPKVIWHTITRQTSILQIPTECVSSPKPLAI